MARFMDRYVVQFMGMAAAALALIMWYLTGAALMLLAGALHHEVSPAIPAFGFWGGVWLVPSIALVGFIFRAPNVGVSRPDRSGDIG